ncbi:MAG: ATP-grasp domain-containing protein [Janthinobacterium lividum]
MDLKGRRLTVGITGLNAHDNPGPGVAVIRSLKEYYAEEIRIVGLAYESLEPGIYMEALVDCVYQIPYPTAGTAALLERLTSIQEREQLHLIIPNFDSELYNFIKIAPQLEKLGIKTFLPSLEQLEARDKVNLYRFGSIHGFQVPNSILINSISDLIKATETLDYPFVIKGKFYEAQIVTNYEAAKNEFYKLSSKWGLPIIAQQYIKGTEINVAGLADGNGKAISVVAMRKLYLTDKGKAWAGITIEDIELVELAKQFADSTKWKGGFELELMKTNEGNLWVMEINPRFPAWIYLTTAAGQNQPAALVKMAMGEEIQPYKAYAAGKMFIRYSWDEIVDISQFQQFAAFGEIINTKNRI